MLPIETLVNVAVTVVFGFFWLVAFVIIYHLARFGIGTTPKKFAAIFLLGGVLLFFGSILLYNSIELNSIQL
ncbi:MAG: hypothetical protein HYT69_02185 [Candidatus Zambryskibacteria bacterium]|nr:hypothetical protein [Candidatus Zambryskibacteria bacterium]